MRDGVRPRGCTPLVYVYVCIRIIFAKKFKHAYTINNTKQAKTQIYENTAFIPAYVHACMHKQIYKTYVYPADDIQKGQTDRQTCRQTGR